MAGSGAGAITDSRLSCVPFQSRVQALTGVSSHNAPQVRGQLSPHGPQSTVKLYLHTAFRESWPYQRQQQQQEQQQDQQGQHEQGAEEEQFAYLGRNAELVRTLDVYVECHSVAQR